MAHRRTRRQPDRPSSNPQPDGPLVNARAWRWQRMLDNGVYASVSEIGDAENISKSYVSRILRLALLAPDVVEEILAGTTNQGMVLEQLERPLPASWKSSVDACSAHHVPRTTSAFVCGMEVSEQTPSSMPLEAQALQNAFSISWSPLSRRRASVLRVRSEPYRSMQEPSSCQP
jgi:hypothetical protein